LVTACQVNDIVVVYAYSYSVGAYSGIGGSGTSGYISKFTGTNTIGNSIISDNGTTASILGKLSVTNTYALDPLISLATTTSGNVEVQLRTATTTYNAGIGVVTSGYDFGLFTNNTTRMTIVASSGDVLINDVAANDYAKLQVNATSGTAFALTNTSAAATDAGNVMFFWGTTGYNSMASIGSFWDAASNSNAYLQFKTRGSGVNTERMRIASSGNVLIGTTTDGGYKLQVEGTTGAFFSYSASSTYFRIMPGAANGTVNLRYGASGGAAPALTFSNDSAVVKMTLADTGNLILSRPTFSSIQAVGCYDDTSAGARSLSITSAGAIVAVPSSLRYKKDVETLDSNISESIYKMRPIWYRSISNHDRDDWSWYGLIAEEIAEIEPRLVQWGYKREDYIINEETKEQELKEGAELQADGVDYARITVLLVAEMQKMRKELNDLKTLVATK
jgi:hypothetical protein